METNVLDEKNVVSTQSNGTNRKSAKLQKVFCVLCNSPTQLVPFKGHHICKSCIEITKQFHRWHQQFD